jgi:cob(I)alamin adenosyltransferase
MGQSIATKKGDDGTTGLLYGQRVSKDHPQVEAVGAYDELNAAIGFAKSVCTSAARRLILEQIQRDLVNMMGEIACAESDVPRYVESSFKKIGDAELARVDAAISSLEASNISFDGWATPGANLPSAALELARTTARRAERRLVSLSRCGRVVRPLLHQYANRIADLLWLMARDAERAAAAPASPA